MLTVNAYAAPSATDPLIATTIVRRDLGPHDVLIDIAYAGICHSDIHTVRGHWGELPTRSPLATRSSDSSARSAPQSPSTRSVIGSGSAANRTPAGTANSASRAKRSTASTATSRPTPASTTTAPSPRVAIRRRRRQRELRAQGPGVAPDREGRTAALRWRHPLLAAEALECRARHQGRDRRHGRPGSRRCKTCSRAGRGGHRPLRTLSKQKDGLELGADHYYATEDPDTFEKLAGRSI